MIKVNLLPKKRTAKKISGIRHLVLGLVLILGVVVALGYVWSNQRTRIAGLKEQVAQASQEKERLKNVNQDKEAHQKNIEDLKHRIDVISQIEKGRMLPLRVLDGITGILNESLPIWLTSLNFDGVRVLFDGYSFTNQDIATFVKKLEESPTLKNVDLQVSQKINQGGKEIFRFSLTAEMEMPQGG
jgi:type IV pilus assembly protein PilN